MLFCGVMNFHLPVQRLQNNKCLPFSVGKGLGHIDPGSLGADLHRCQKMDGSTFVQNEMVRAFVMFKSLSEIVALLLDGWLQAPLPNSKVSECVKGESSLLFPWVAIRYHQTF